MTLVQRRLASLGALTVITVGALFAVDWQTQKSAEHEEKQAAAKKLFSIRGLSDVKTLRLTNAFGTFAIDHVGDGETGWQITTPRQTLAEASTLDSMARSALELRVTGRVGGNPNDSLSAVETPPDLKIFGLAPPQSTFTLVGRDGYEQSLDVGVKSTYSDALFVKRTDRTEVAYVEGAFAFQLDKDLFKLRDKRLLVIEPAKVTRLSVSGKGVTSYVIERSGADSFKLTAPVSFAADESMVSGMLTALSNLRAKQFIAEEPAANILHDTGLDNPALRVELAFKDGPSATLAFSELSLGGKIGGASHYFARREGEGASLPIIEVGSDWALKKLRVSPQELRDLHVLSFERDAVKTLTLTHGDDVLVFVKEHDDKEKRDTWRLQKPQSAAAQGAKVASLLYKLWNLKGDALVKEAPSGQDLTTDGLDKPFFRVDLTGADDKFIGSVIVGAEANSKRYATSDKHAFVVAVPSSALQDIAFTAADYKEAAAAAAATAANKTD